VLILLGKLPVNAGWRFRKTGMKRISEGDAPINQPKQAAIKNFNCQMYCQEKTLRRRLFYSGLSLLGQPRQS
jgi:hypothetical protein